MAAMKAVVLFSLVALVHQASAAVFTRQWLVPATLNDTIVVGDTIIWNWADTRPHNVNFLTVPAGFTGLPANGSNSLVIPRTPVAAPYNVSFTPTIPGTYNYDCSVHPATMVGTLIVRQAAANGTSNTTAVPPPVTGNTTAILPLTGQNATANATATNATAIQTAVVARTLGLATAAITQNVTTLPTFITSDFSVFAANVSGPLTIANLTAILGYLRTNQAAASAANSLANTTAPVVKQFILINPTAAYITAQIPALQHFASILWTFTNATNGTTANWFARNAVFLPAPISLA